MLTIFFLKLLNVLNLLTSKVPKRQQQDSGRVYPPSHNNQSCPFLEQGGLLVIKTLHFFSHPRPAILSKICSKSAIMLDRWFSCLNVCSWQRQPKLQARDAGIWWGTLGKLQLMLRKAAKALYQVGLVLNQRYKPNFLVRMTSSRRRRCTTTGWLWQKERWRQIHCENKDRYI